jgi:hypothetical protein
MGTPQSHPFGCLKKTESDYTLDYVVVAHNYPCFYSIMNYPHESERGGVKKINVCYYAGMCSNGSGGYPEGVGVRQLRWLTTPPFFRPLPAPGVVPGAALLQCAAPCIQMLPQKSTPAMLCSREERVWYTGVTLVFRLYD